MYALEAATYATEENQWPRGPELAAQRRRLDGRDHVERLLNLASVLPESDRLLLEAIYRDGRSCVSLARLMGVPVRPLRGRVRRLTTRLASPLFRFVVAKRGSWPASRRRIATVRYIHGRSINGTASELGIPRHAVRVTSDFIRQLFEDHAGTEARP